MEAKKFLIILLTISALSTFTSGEFVAKEKTNDERREEMIEPNSILAKILLVIVNDSKFKETNQWSQLEIMFNVLKQLSKIFKENGLI